MQVRSLGQEDPLQEENGSLFQYSCLENLMDRGAWRATVHGVTQSQSDITERLTISLSSEGKAEALLEVSFMHD